MSSKEKAINQTMVATDWGLLVLLSVLWGATYFFVAVAVNYYTPLVIVLARVGIAAFALVLLLIAMRIPITRSASVWGAFFIMGILNNLIPFTLMTWGQTHIASGLAAMDGRPARYVSAALGARSRGRA